MNDYNLKDRRAIITGGAQGFGYAITKRFLESGAEVIIWDIDQKAIDEALKELQATYEKNQEERDSGIKEHKKPLGMLKSIKLGGEKSDL